jgi:membrane-associated phospholipid phosphatase
MIDSRSCIRAAALVLACVLMTISSAFAQTSSSDPSQSQTPDSAPTAPSPHASNPSLERQFFRNLLRDQRAIWTSPFHLKEGNAWALIAVGGASTALLLSDEHTSARLGDNVGRFRISNNVSRVGAWYGVAGVTGAFYLVGRTTGNAKARETGVLCAEALIDGLIVGQALKAIAQRKRPLDQPGEAQFFNGGSAFPSGHSVNAWALASVVAHEYDNLPAQISAYALAGLVSVSRFTGRRHYLSDIFVGGAIGYGIGSYVYRAHHDPALDADAHQAGNRGGKWRPAVSPIFSRANREYGLSLAWGL